MDIRLKDLAGLLGRTTLESVEVYDEGATCASPVLVGGCGVYGERVVDQVIPGVHYDGHRAVAYLTVWLRMEDEE